jgi:dienelactone hydrolase
MKTFLRTTRHLLLVLACSTTCMAQTQAAVEADPSGFAQGIKQGKVIQLQAGDKQVMAIHTEEVTGSRQGGIILIPDINTHPDWPQVIRPLRTQPTEFGWHTLAINNASDINLDAMENLDALIEQTRANIQAGVAFYQQQNIGNVAVIGYGIGATLAAAAISRSDEGISAFIGISMSGARMPLEDLYTPPYLETISLPILDIFGSQDLPHVVDSAKARSVAAKKSGASSVKKQRINAFKRSAVARSPFAEKSGYIAYRQIQIAGADHQFTGLGQILTKRIIGWLRQHASGVTVSSDNQNNSQNTE